MNVLVVNGGSSSLKCWFHRLSADPLPNDAPTPLWSAHVERSDGSADVDVTVSSARGELKSRSMLPASSLVETLPTVLSTLWSGDTKVIGGPGEIDFVGHRIVHGGRAFRDIADLTPEVRETIARQSESAPVHNRMELSAVQQVERILGSRVRQLAVFDTTFHSTLPPEAFTYPGPYGWLRIGIRRFGFHGVSHQYAARCACEILGRQARTVICHLGSGCSLAAVQDGKSVDTTMGFTPVEGLMMATRSGSIDPSILLYLQRHHGCSVNDLDRILNQESGLKGLSGVSGDMREVLAAAAAGDTRAQLAFDVYVHRLCREVGAMCAVLGGCEALVFTGGVGENCAPLRERVCRQLEFLGLRLDLAKNAEPGKNQNVAAAESSVAVLVIHAEEEWEIARQCFEYVRKGRTH